jgi:cysteine desulfurase/selenocysteine lyase
MDTIKTIRSDFPIYSNSKKMCYFDYAATTFMPACVIEAWNDYHRTIGISVNRSKGKLANKAGEALRLSRSKISGFFDADRAYDLVFTKNATEALNMIASGIISEIGVGDIIITSVLEHHSAILPWMRVVEEKGAILVQIPLKDDGNLDYSILEGMGKHRVKVVCCTYVSNVTGHQVNVELLRDFARETGAYFFLDVSQAVSSKRIHMETLGADGYVMSAHKMYGPKNIGGLFLKKSLLPRFKPLILGGGMVWSTFGEKPIWADGVEKLEAGTFDVGLTIAWARACQYIEGITYEQIKDNNKSIHELLSNRLNAMKNFSMISSGSNQCENLISIIHNRLHAHDIEQWLDERGIVVRSGHMCSQSTMNAMGLTSLIRISWGLGVDAQRVDQLVDAFVEIDNL